MGKQSLARQWIRQHFWGVGILVVLLIGSGWTVKHFQRPGQMTVIEAQAMDMSAMKPPVGSVPVATEIVSERPFSTTVNYTGSVAPLNEENIYPHIDGWLNGLNVYNGDEVRAGQLLATLDSPDIRSKLAEAASNHIAALRAVPVSQANLVRMRAERSAASAAVVGAAKDVDAARANQTATQRTVAEAQKELKSAQASLKYWQAEIKREADLLKNGAVSQQEFDSEQAQSTAAEAEVENKESKVQEAQAKVAAARAEVSNKESMLQVARDNVTAADASLAAASGDVSQKIAMANTAGAEQATAASIDDYRLIRAPFNGVVTNRYINSGVLVNPSMAIINVAQIDKVRLQADVAEEDLGSIKLGAPVVAHVSKGSGKTIHARVTSITPSTDQTSRTAVVEAIVDNPGHFLVPGDFVSMDITTSTSADAITVPATALTTKDGKDAVWIARSSAPAGKILYTCTMHPDYVTDKPGNCPKCGMKLVPKTASTGKTAHLVYVTVGKGNGSRVEILDGLNVGDEVIYKGNDYLKEGDAVTPTTWDENGPVKLPPPPDGGKMMNMPGMGNSSDNKNMSGMDMSGSNSSDSNMSGMDMSSNGGHKDQSAQHMSGMNMSKSNMSKMSTHTKTSAAKYVCPMHPDFVTNDPNAHCPKCGMKVVPRKG